MTQQLLASKVVVREEEPRVRGIPSAPTSVAGMLGVTQRGPIGEAVHCGSIDEVQRRFGGFTLGSITADKGDDEATASVTHSHSNGVSGSPPVAPGRHQNDPTRCQSDRAVIYRDLMVTFPHPMGEPASQAHDGDGSDD